MHLWLSVRTTYASRSWPTRCSDFITSRPRWTTRRMTWTSRWLRLGQRLVKRTVNFDNPGVFHFYYGNERGTPGTIWTTFPYKDKGVRSGIKGHGQVTTTAFSVPAGSLDTWSNRLTTRGIRVERAAQPVRRRRHSVLRFVGPHLRARGERLGRPVALGARGHRRVHGDSRLAQRHADRPVTERDASFPEAVPRRRDDRSGRRPDSRRRRQRCARPRRSIS